MASQAGDEVHETATARPPTGSAHAHHGNSVAAWTMVLVVMVGAVIVSVAVAAASVALAVVGAVVIVVGLIAGKVLSLAGYGSVKPANPEQPHGVA